MPVAPDSRQRDCHGQLAMGNVPWGIAMGNLPWGIAMGNCHGELPWGIAIASRAQLHHSSCQPCTCPDAPSPPLTTVATHLS
eukprot:351767-Chlamydomonas_euryale.AAC.2